MKGVFAALGLSPTHWVLIVLLGVVLFRHRVPALARAIGSGLFELKSLASGNLDRFEGRADENARAPTAGSGGQRILPRADGEQHGQRSNHAR
jgi:Sec-independent protein translocase protein TatA